MACLCSYTWYNVHPRRLNNDVRHDVRHALHTRVVCLTEAYKLAYLKGRDTIESAS